MDTLIAFDEIKARLLHFREGHLSTRYAENPLLLGLSYTLVALQWEGTAELLSDTFISDKDHFKAFDATLSRLGYQCLHQKITHHRQLETLSCPAFISINCQNYILLGVEKEVLHLYDYENDIPIESPLPAKFKARVCAISSYSRIFREPPPESQDKRNWVKHIFYEHSAEFKSLALLSLFITL